MNGELPRGAIEQRERTDFLGGRAEVPVRTGPRWTGPRSGLARTLLVGFVVGLISSVLSIYLYRLLGGCG